MALYDLAGQRREEARKKTQVILDTVLKGAQLGVQKKALDIKQQQVNSPSKLWKEQEATMIIFAADKKRRGLPLSDYESELLGIDVPKAPTDWD